MSLKFIWLAGPNETSITLQLANMSIKHSWREVEDLILKARDFIFPNDFIVPDIEEIRVMLMILERPFLVTGHALLGFEICEMILRVEDKQQSFFHKYSTQHAILPWGVQEDRSWSKVWQCNSSLQ